MTLTVNTSATPSSLEMVEPGTGIEPVSASVGHLYTLYCGFPAYPFKVLQPAA